MTPARFFRLTLHCLVVLLAIPAFSQENERQYLSGHGKDDAVPWKFFCTAGAQSGFWTNLPVPSNWELHGFGTLNYQRDSTNANPEQGRYERDFTVPAEWSQRRVFLVFDGIMTDTHASLNGQPAGPVHQGGFYRFKYEITRLLKFGATNRLEVLVDKHSANESVNRAERQGDYWLFGGIYRPVYLEAAPPQFIERVAIDARADGAFAMEVFVDGATNTDTIEAQVFELDGKPVGQTFLSASSPDFPVRSSDGRLESRPNWQTGTSALLKTQIPSPRQWTAETPNLYRVEVRLRRDGQVRHRYSQRFGFRTMEVREGDGLYVNGRRVVLKGANRHSFWPDSGRCLSEAVHRLDIEVMKDMNMNAVRMSHYPPDEQFLDLCDELGFYVLDELGGWQKSYDTATGRRLIEEMVTRDVNHPSILFWDNGNEGGWNTEVDGEFGKWDPQQRRVLHPWATFGGVNTAHYRTYEVAKAMSASNVIHMPTEFLHGLYDGGAGAGMEDYWEMMRRGKTFAGGFVWALVDEGVKRPDTGRIDVFGNKAPDGIVGPYREREGSFYTIKELWSPIVVARDTNNVFTVENRYSFTDANQCKFYWQLWKFALTPPAEQLAASPSIPPGGVGKLELKLPARWQESDALSLRVVDPTGRSLCNWVWPLPGLGHFRRSIAAPAKQKAVAKETADVIEVQAGDLRVRINRQTGMLASVQRGTHTFSFTNGPRPAVGSATLANLERKAEGSDYVVASKFEGALRSVIWRVRGNGWVQCDYVYAATGPQDYHGVVFDYPESLVKKKRWLGDGPFRVWQNRRRGVALNVWENNYNNTITGWRDWEYPEFKGCFANVRWLQLETAEGTITSVPGAEGGFVQVLTPELPPANLMASTVISLPRAGLAFLHAIPPIGSKFHRPRDAGPQGKTVDAKGTYSGSVNFFFGELPAL